MLKKFILASILFSTVAAGSAAEAREWTIVGPRALGMGGAGVAVANDSTASYWNPAAFGFFSDGGKGEYGKRGWSAALDAGFGARVNEDLGEFVDRIANADFGAIQAGTDLAEVPDFIELITDLKLFDDNPDRALTISANTALSVQVGRFGLAGYGFGDISARGDLDLVNIGPVTAGDPTPTFTIAEITDPATYGCAPCATTGYFSASERTGLETYLAGLGWTAGQATDFINIVENGIDSLPPGTALPASSEVVTQVENAATVANAAAGSGGTIDNNTSKLIFKGLAVAEVPLTYGRKITDDFAVGGNIKFMTARVYNTEVQILNQNTDFGDALSTALDDYTDSANFGVDLGAIYRFGDNLRFGVVARNINSPSFDMKPLVPGDKDSISEDAQVRAGVAWRPFKPLLVAADIDLTENDISVLSGASTSRMVSAGVEGNLFNFLQLRAGVYKNIANDDIGPVYTAGLGINLWAVNVDLGGAMSSGSTTIDGNEIPREVKVEFALSALF